MRNRPSQKEPYAPGRNRTCDLALRRRTLYPLSYRRGPFSLAPMEMTARSASLELAQTFVIARESTDLAEVVQVEISHDGVSGFGEGAPIERYAESTDSALAYVEEHAGALGDEPFALDEIESQLEPREWAARSAIDAALHDLQGKLLDIPVWRVPGGRQIGPPPPRALSLGAAG